MSNHLAIATVTAGLRQLLLPAVQAAVAGADITLARPHAGAADAASAESANVNLYLYQASPNAALRNADLPTRSGEGKLVQRPAAGYDLHYLLTFYGSQKALEPERLLGSVLKTMHARPTLDRALLARLIDDPDSGYPDLAGSNLHTAVDLVQFRPLPLSLEELSKLWSVFLQTPYTLSIACIGSLVLIEGDSAPATALPVRQRRIFVETLRQPLLDAAEADGDPQRALHATSRLGVRGRQLHGDGLTRLRIGRSEFAPGSVPAADLRAGIQSLQVLQYRAGSSGPQLAAESNALPIQLHPLLSGLSRGTPTLRDGLFDVDIGFDVRPPLAAGQRVALLLNGVGGAAPKSYSLALASPTTGTGHVDSTLAGIAAGDYLLRVVVDGVASLLEVDAGGRYSGPKVSVA
jgi:hypothetical protein